MADECRGARHDDAGFYIASFARMAALTNRDTSEWKKITQENLL